MEQISIEQKMLMALLGAELAKNGKDFSDLSQLLIDIESTNDVGQIFKIIAKYYQKQAKQSFANILNSKISSKKPRNSRISTTQKT